jgi:hypothetical protein
MPHTRKPSWSRIVVSFLIVVGVCGGIALLGFPNAALIIIVGAVLGTTTAVYRHIRPLPPKARQGKGWRMDRDGNYRWWDGSAWADGPDSSARDTRKVGPEIEW